MSDQLMEYRADVVIVGATPAGLAAAIAAADRNLTVIILERLKHIGGLPANGLGATDISTRGAGGGLFKEFTERVRAFYAEEFGENSPQVDICSDGFHFEPSVAEIVLNQMVDEHSEIQILTGRQFDALSSRVVLDQGRISSIQALDLATGNLETFAGAAFIDATYEGDLAGAAGVGFETRREGYNDYQEPMAGRVYQAWHGKELGEGSTLEGDDTIQAYNFRLCLTDNPENRVPIRCPKNYNREEYASLAEDIKLGRMPGSHVREREWDGIGRIVNIVWLPNGKTDANNQHLAFISTDLPEENWAWPIADWAWRDQYQQRLQEYTLGLLWFMQNDPEVPESYRKSAARFGLAANEYEDNENFPRQVYVREGRRINGRQRFLAHDAIPMSPDGRPPVHENSITASHYPIDSHAIHKREPHRVHLDGFISYPTRPYTVPYGITVADGFTNLWVPVAVSASHLGFGTLRMEPCWMAIGEAAGTAAAVALERGESATDVSIEAVQKALLERDAVLIYFKDVTRDDPAFAPVQYLALRGFFPDWEARLDEPAEMVEVQKWAASLSVVFGTVTKALTRREALVRLWEELSQAEEFQTAFSTANL